MMREEQRYLMKLLGPQNHLFWLFHSLKVITLSVKFYNYKMLHVHFSLEHENIDEKMRLIIMIIIKTIAVLK